ncbi:MAG: hypothetical protein H6767_03800 [Candidatus Peribacteria bacterium]|nr:MAG: hypothetical protein H6767_03800 [Candidatus Peribacteria bacterium]
MYLFIALYFYLLNNPKKHIIEDENNVIQIKEEVKPNKKEKIVKSKKKKKRKSKKRKKRK